MENVLKTETEIYDAMISIGEKSYILFKDGKMTIRGSSLKGLHQPRVCDAFRDALCLAVFTKRDPHETFKQFQDLSRFSVQDFQIRIYSSKVDYVKSTLYAKLIRQLASRGLRVIAGHSIEYVKTVSDYKPVLLFSDEDRIDYDYYKNRLAQITSRILAKPAKALRKLFGSGQKILEEFK